MNFAALRTLWTTLPTGDRDWHGDDAVCQAAFALPDVLDELEALETNVLALADEFAEGGISVGQTATVRLRALIHAAPFSPVEIKCVYCGLHFGRDGAGRVVDRETWESGCAVRGGARRTRWWHKWTRRNLDPAKDWHVPGFYRDGVLLDVAGA